MTAPLRRFAPRRNRTIVPTVWGVAIPVVVLLVVVAALVVVGGVRTAPMVGSAAPPSLRAASNSTSLSLSASATPTHGGAPLTVRFSATPVGGSAPYRVGFDFGDGSPALLLNNSGNGTANQVNHTYSRSGNLTAYLWVNDSVGASNSTTLLLTVTGGPSGGNGSAGVTIVASPTSGAIPLNVTFTARITGNGTPTGFNWSFGDGGSGTGNPTNHIYTIAGSFLVSVQVSGLVASGVVVANATVVATNGSGSGSGNSSGVQPNATVSPYSGSAPLSVTFTTAPFGGTSPYLIAWSFGDGTYSGLVSVSGTPQVYSLVHNFSAVGAYYPSIVVNDSAGHRAVQSFTVQVTAGNGTPQLTVAAAPSHGPAPLPVTLWANVSGNATPTGYRWVFGDGGNGTGTAITHRYASPGIYRAVVFVSGVLPNASLIGNTTITVTNGSGSGSGNGSLQIGLSATPTSGSAPLNVTVVANVTGGTAPYQLAYCQYIGNGSCNLTTLATNVSAGSPVLLHLTENVSGTVTVLVRAVDASFNSSLATVGIIVRGGGPLTAHITLNTTSGLEPLVVGLNASVTGGTAPYTIQWFFGDGSVGSSLSGGVVAHTYEAGHFWPVLRVSDSAGHGLIRAAPHDIVVTANGTGGCALPLVSTPTGGLMTVLSTLPVSVWLVVVAVGGLGAGLAVSAVGYHRLRRRLERAEGETLALTMEGPLRPPNG